MINKKIISIKQQIFNYLKTKEIWDKKANLDGGITFRQNVINTENGIIVKTFLFKDKNYILIEQNQLNKKHSTTVTINDQTNTYPFLIYIMLPIQGDSKGTSYEDNNFNTKITKKPSKIAVGGSGNIFGCKIEHQKKKRKKKKTKKFLCKIGNKKHSICDRKLANNIFSELREALKMHKFKECPHIMGMELMVLRIENGVFSTMLCMEKMVGDLSGFKLLINELVHKISTGKRILFVAMHQSLLGLDFMHNLNEIHYDLKPENIFFTLKSGSKEVYKLLKKLQENPDDSSLNFKNDLKYHSLRKKFYHKTLKKYKKSFSREIKIFEYLTPDNIIFRIGDLGITRNMATLQEGNGFSPYYIAPENADAHMVFKKVIDKKLDIWSLGILLLEFGGLKDREFPLKAEVHPFQVPTVIKEISKTGNNHNPPDYFSYYERNLAFGKLGRFMSRFVFNMISKMLEIDTEKRPLTKALLKTCSQENIYLKSFTPKEKYLASLIHEDFSQQEFEKLSSEIAIPKKEKIENNVVLKHLSEVFSKDKMDLDKFLENQKLILKFLKSKHEDDEEDNSYLSDDE